ncbi:MAG: DUF4215 domain-containing protein [Myxococcales bacterium]|nr:DUF4215 domain-containing protein [Myxococcales bacterium]
MYVEALAANDDDGDLGNGTPDVCEINAAFGAHGLRAISATVADVSVGLSSDLGHPVRVYPEGLYPQCGDTLGGGTLEWQLRDEFGPGGSVPLVDTGGVLEGIIPRQADGAVVQYRVSLNIGGSTQELPTNLADPWYEFYVGPVTPIYCTGFETDPRLEGWTTAGGEDDWEWGVPSTVGGDDPQGAFTGASVFGNDLGGFGDGRYAPYASNFAQTPVIDGRGYQKVRLQYRRWLGVEDGVFDSAQVIVNGVSVWRNAVGGYYDGSIHHLDGDWRFHDIDLTPYASPAGTVQIAFRIDSDGGLEFGGWTLDELCVVGVGGAPPAAACGDGKVDAGEACDDGNTIPGDGCSAACQFEPVTPPTTGTDTDTDTDTDTGDTEDTDPEEDGDLVGRGCGCDQRRDPGLPMSVLTVMLILGLRRRSRR